MEVGRRETNERTALVMDSGVRTADVVGQRKHQEWEKGTTMETAEAIEGLEIGLEVCTLPYQDICGLSHLFLI